MFHFLNKNLNLQLFLLFLLTGWAGWTIFTRMTIIPADGTMIFFRYVSRLWTWNDLPVRILVMLMVIAMTVSVIQHFYKRHFTDNTTYLPGVFLLLLLNCGHFLSTLTPALLTVFFITLIMLMYIPNEQAGKTKDRLFSFGLLVAFATLLDISAFGIVLFLIMMIAVNNVTSFKDIIILFLGLSFPYIWAFAIAFISNGLPEFTQTWHTLSLFVPVKSFTTMRVLNYIALAWFAVATIALTLRDKRLLDNKLIVIRQAFSNVNLLLISMLLFLFLGITPFPMALLYLSIPVAIYMSIAVIQKKRWVLVDILIVTLFLLLWL